VLFRSLVLKTDGRERKVKAAVKQDATVARTDDEQIRRNRKTNQQS